MNKIKLLKASPFYQDAIDNFYNTTIGLKEETYQNQYKVLMGSMWGWADFWKKNLENTDTFEVEEIITNCGYLQKKWASENNITYSYNNWLLEILYHQILQFKPDVFFAHDYWNITPDFIKRVRKNCPEIKLVMSWDGIGKNDANLFSECQLMLSCLNYVCDFYRNNGAEAYYFPPAFEETINNKLTFTEKKYDFTFVGSIFTGNGGHNKRKNDIMELLRKTPLKLWSKDIDNQNWKPYKYPQRQRLKQLKFKEFYDMYLLGSKCKGAASGLEMYQLLADSKITFNSHIDVAKNFAANMRLFEATGVGTCLLTDWKENISDFFEPETEVVTYKSIDECANKVKYLLKHPEIAEEIAKKGQQRTITNHTFKVRLTKFSNYLIHLI